MSSSSEEKRPLRRFSLADIRKATNNFDEALIIRRGGFGEVYKGTYSDYVGTRITQKTVAVKCLNFGGRHFPGWFELEMEAWSQYYRHKNIVPVIGYCRESGHNIVVYEYRPNGSLANHLCTKTTSSSFSLSWEQCLGICIDAARGLEYLHTSITYSNGCRFYHADVTATNILLDENAVAKVSDLYSEPLLGKYMASCLDPHYHSTGKVSRSSDVYAFGILLMKVLCRKVSFDDEDKNLGIWLHRCITNGTIDQIIHPDMKPQIPPIHLKNFVFMAGECLDAYPKKRPSATDLVNGLKLAMTSSAQRFCHRFSFPEIEEATNNFENLLGEGGEGKVYRGETNTGIPIAVKLLKPEYSSAFEKEIKMLSKLDHPNLISLVGNCHESDYQKMIIYELMCNGNLETALNAGSLSWDQRLNICIGAARGLRYLHTSTKESPKGIIHRDMKPANILLDENFEAKISDFGLSKMSLQDQTNSEMPTMVKGTRGYYAPEYQSYGEITRRIDVYAFGVILTEVLCRKKPWDREYSFYPTEDEKYSIWAPENVDPDLEGAISPSCLWVFTDILEKCLNQNPSRRPSMGEVVSGLENAQKWQEAWQKNDSGVLFYLPGVEDRVVLYYTSNSEDDTFEDCLRARLFLRRFGVPIDERDPTKDQYASKEFKQVFGNMSNLRLPKVFVRGKYIGGVEIMNKRQELAKFLGVQSPRFVCKNCGEARSCHTCNQEEWYVLCRNCNALTKVIPEEREGDLRSCLQCNGNQFIYEANLETQ